MKGRWGKNIQQLLRQGQLAKAAILEISHRWSNEGA